MVVAAGRGEHRLATRPLPFLEPDHVPPEAERAVDIRDLQVNMADPRAGITAIRRADGALPARRRGGTEGA